MVENFWDELASHGEAIALVDGESGTAWSYSAVAKAVDAGALRFRASHKKFIVIAAKNDVNGILCYLSALRAGHAVYLCGYHQKATLTDDFICRYAPDILVCNSSYAGYRSIEPLFGYNVAEAETCSGAIHDELAVLLATSGTTGSHKLVRLSASNLSAGANQVILALDIRPGNRGIASLPLSFVYGLSVLHSHLAAGASIVATARSVLDHLFWETLQTSRVTSMAGVPWTFRTLRQIGFEKFCCPDLRKLTHSGGQLDEDTRQWLVGTFPQRGVEIYLMYGQTEAGGRISVLPPSVAQAKPQSVGKAVAGGHIDCGAGGEITYHGPNVMQGYATCREDLKRGNDLNGTLRTGDLGYVDADGDLHLMGRSARFCKLLGLRISLDDIEAELGKTHALAAVSDDDNLYIFAEGGPGSGLAAAIDRLGKQIGIPPSIIVVKELAALPRSPSGKILYSSLAALAASRD